MSCTTAVGLHHTLNCTLFNATVAPLLMTDFPTRMSISATMWLSPSCPPPTCYLQDRDEIANDVITTISPGTPKPLCESHRSVVNTLTVQSDINPRATVASTKVLFGGRKSLELTSFCPLSRSRSRHFALSGALYRPCTGRFANFPA